MHYNSNFASAPVISVISLVCIILHLTVHLKRFGMRKNIMLLALLGFYFLHREIFRIWKALSLSSPWNFTHHISDKVFGKNENKWWGSFQFSTEHIESYISTNLSKRIFVAFGQTEIWAFLAFGLFHLSLQRKVHQSPWKVLTHQGVTLGDHFPCSRHCF